jgi:hypothetical protein
MPPALHQADRAGMTSFEHDSPPPGAHAPLATIGPRTGRRPSRNPRLYALAALLLAVPAGAGSWYILHSDGASTPTRAPANTASPSVLAALRQTVGHPVYWAGPKAGFRYELTHTSDGRIYIRYLPSDVAAGSSAPKYLTVGTYPVNDALATVRAIGAKTGGSLMKLASGGVAAVDPDHPLSIYIAYPGSGYEIEVYDPTPNRARELVSSGAIVPTDGSTAAVTPVRPTAASIDDLRALASSSAHPVYWAGERAGTTYEMSELSDGRIFVRYLPKGVAVGDRQPLPTVGTYPAAQAYAAVQTIARRAGATKIRLSGGGLAVIEPAHPTSIYLAYPHGRVEVEVFDPSAAQARRLIESGAITPVR